MAGALTDLLDSEQERILVAIDPNLDNALDVAGGLTLAPKLGAGTTVEPGVACLDGAGQRGRIHVRDHQRIVRPRIDDDAGDQPVSVELR